MTPDIETVPLDEVDFFAPDMEEAFDRRRFCRTLLAVLTEREERVLRLRHGFNGPCHTLDGIAQEMPGTKKLTRERIRCIEQKAYRRIKSQTYVKQRFGEVRDLPI